MIKKLIMSAMFLHILFFTYAQGVAINTNGNQADASAALDINNNAKGLLIPRLTTAERNQINSPATALLIFNKDSLKFQVNIGSSASPIWSSIVTVNNLPEQSGNTLGWSLSGNSDVSTNAFLGTKDNKPMVIKTSDVIRLFIDGTNTKVGIGTATPTTALDINTTDAIKVPVGTTSQRPTSPTVGMIRYNNTTNKLEGYTTNGWVSLN